MWIQPLPLDETIHKRLSDKFIIQADPAHVSLAPPNGPTPLVSQKVVHAAKG